MSVLDWIKNEILNCARWKFTIYGLPQSHVIKIDQIPAKEVTVDNMQKILDEHRAKCAYEMMGLHSGDDRETLISKSSHWSYLYALNKKKAQFELGEPAISSQDPMTAYKYADFVLGGRFPLGEAAIASHPEASYSYARFVLKGPFPEGEDAIKRYPELYQKYLKFLKSATQSSGAVNIRG